LLQKPFCGMGLKFSEPQARRSNNSVGTTPSCANLTGDSGSGFEAALIGDLSLVSSFRGKLIARRFGSFATLSVQKLTWSEGVGTSVLPRILLQKSFWGEEQKFLEPLMRFTRGDVRGPYRFIQNRPRTFLVALKSDAAAETSKNQLSRDFWG
jgi:hypothetical protein